MALHEGLKYRVPVRLKPLPGSLNQLKLLHPLGRQLPDEVVEGPGCAHPPAVAGHRRAPSHGPRDEAVVLCLYADGQDVVDYLPPRELVEPLHRGAPNVDVVAPVPREVDREVAGTLVPEVLDEDVQELLGFVLRGGQALAAEPVLLRELGFLAAGTEIRGVSHPLLAAGAARPPVVALLAGEVEVVGVDVEDQISSLPALVLHVGPGVLVVGRGEVGVSRGVLPHVTPELLRVLEAYVAEH